MFKDFGPMTEDMIDDHVFNVQNLNEEVQNRLKFDILLSDMQAFKV